METRLGTPPAVSDGHHTSLDKPKYISSRLCIEER